MTLPCRTRVATRSSMAVLVVETVVLRAAGRLLFVVAALISGQL